MDAELKERWATALESGKYEQARGTLMSPGETPAYCCLGVLCELLREEGKVERHYFTDDNSDPYFLLKPEFCVDDSPSAMDTELDSCTLEAIGMSREEHDRAVSLNDNFKKDFEEIAEWIRADMPLDTEP